jgi:hypothetical protein
MLEGVAQLELLYWDGCPSHPQALRELRAALEQLGRGDETVALTKIATEAQAAQRGFIGSPTLLIDGVDAVPAPAGEPTGLTCRLYRRRDGRASPTPDPDDLLAALQRSANQSAEEDRR